MGLDGLAVVVLRSLRGVCERLPASGGDLVACAVGPEATIPPERRERRPRAGVEQRSESGGGGLLGPLLALFWVPVGWFGSGIAVLNILNHLLGSDPSAVATLGLSPRVSLWVSIAVLVGVGFALLVRPGTVLWGWLIMGVLAAVGATFSFGWTPTILFYEALTVVVVTLAMFMSVVVAADKGIVAALALNRRMR